MTKLPAKNGPAKVVVSSRGIGGRAGGHRGGRKWPDAFRLRAQVVADRAKILEVLGHIASGDILEMVRADGETIIYGPTRNADRIKAAELLGRFAGSIAEPAPAPPAGDINYVIFAPPRAKNAEQWLALYAKDHQ